MRAQQVTSLEGPAALQLVDVDEPQSDTHMLIDVAAAGASFPDVLLTRGLYQMKPPLPFIPGVEVAGAVRSAPPDSGFHAGDSVMAFVMLGGFAECALADPALTVHIPERLNIEAAGGFLMNYHTAHFALLRRARVQAGDVVAVHGAAGGVGTAAIQVCRGAGAVPVAVVSSEEKAEVARRAGAETIVLTDDDWAGALRAMNDGRGVDVILDPVGGDRFDESVRCLAPEGRLVVVGFTEGRIPSIQVNRLLFRNVDVVGAAWGAFLPVDPGMFAAAQEELNAMIHRGFVAPIVDTVLPLESAGDALRLIEQRKALGKVVVRVSA